MKTLLLILIFCLNYQNQTESSYKLLQGKWICTTQKYKKHTFWVKGMSFFQKDKNGVIEQALQYDIQQSEVNDIGFTGLLTKCNECWDDDWYIESITKSQLVLIDAKTDDTAKYTKVKTTKK